LPFFVLVNSETGSYIVWVRVHFAICWARRNF
jgi:hypothetical protein